MDYGGKTYADSGPLTGTMREVQAVKGGIQGCGSQFHLSHKSSGWKEFFFFFLNKIGIFQSKKQVEKN